MPALPAPAEEKDIVELTYMGQEGDELAAELFSLFERRNPHIKVFFGQAAERYHSHQRLLCSIVGKAPPDVVKFDRFAVGEWACRGAFLNLGELYERDRGDPEGIREELFYPAAWKEAVYEGGLYAIPTLIDVRLLYYNKDLLAQAGFVDEAGEAVPPKTWAELEDYALALTRYEDNDKENGAIRAAGFVPLPSWSSNSLYLYAWQNGGAYLSEDGRTCAINEPRIAGALDWFVQLADKLGGAERLAVFQSSFQREELDPFLHDKVAMEISGNWLVNTIANYRKDMNFGAAPAPTPTGDDFLTWSGGHSFVIPSESKHPAEAWELIKFLSSREALAIAAKVAREERMAEGEAYLPMMYARRDVTEEMFQTYIFDDPTVPERFKDFYKVCEGLAPLSRYRPVTPVGQMMWDEQSRAMERAVHHEAPSAQAALDAAQKVLQRRLDDIYRERVEPVVPLAAIVLAYALTILLAAAGLILYFRRQGARSAYFRREYQAGILFATPFLLGFVVFTGGPIVFSFLMSFCDYDIFNPARWTGWKNWDLAFNQDPLFWKSMGNTVFMALGIPLGMAVSLGVAMLLANDVRGMSTYRTFFYLPAIVPVVAASLLWLWVFQPTNGLLNWLLDIAGIDGPAWLQNKDWSKPSLILMGLWSAGASMIIWLAGLKGIPEHLYEAAEIDGAGAWKRFLHVTLPMLSPYIFFNLVMGLIGTFQIFSQAFIMTEGGPVDSTLFYAYHLFNNAFRYMDMGYACALAWILFAIVFVLTMIQLSLAKKWVHYQAEN